MASLLNFLLGLASGVVGGEMKSRVALCIICWFDFPFYFFSFLFFFAFFLFFGPSWYHGLLTPLRVPPRWVPRAWKQDVCYGGRITEFAQKVFELSLHLLRFCSGQPPH